MHAKQDRQPPVHVKSMPSAGPHCCKEAKRRRQIPKVPTSGWPRYIFWESTDDTMSNEAEDDDETPYLEAWDELSCEILHHKPDRGKMLCAHQPAVCLRRLGAYQLSCLSPGHDQDDADKGDGACHASSQHSQLAP